MCFDFQGQLLASCAALTPGDIHPLTLEAVATAAKLRIDTASGFFLGRNRRCYVDLVHPGHLADQRPVIWVARFDTRHFFRNLLGYYLKSSRTGESYLVRPTQQGVQLMSPLRFKPDQAPDYYLPVDQPNLTAAQAAKGVRGMTDGVDYRGNAVISAIREVKGTPWLLITEVDHDEVIYGLREQAVLIAGMTSCLLGFAGLGISRLYRNRQQALQRRLDLAESLQDQSVAFHQDVLHTAMDGFCVLDETGHIRDANETYAQMTGYSLDELRHMRIGDFEVLETPEQTAALISRIIKQGSDRFESLQKRKDGSTFNVETSVQHRPEHAWFVVFVRDISNRKRLEADLRQALDQATMASRTKGEFLAVMNHELRTPLNSVLGFAELLAKTPLTPEQREFLANIHESGEHLLQHVADILDFISMGNSGIPSESKPFNLSEVCGPSLLEPFHVAAQSKHQRLQCNISPMVPEWVIGDAGRLRRILTHLIDNAVKFSHAGTIRLAVFPQFTQGPDWIAFTVTDEGPGVEAGQRERIFEPFAQVNSALSRPYEGVGLGLAVCRKLAQSMGGSLSLVSADEPGASFLLLLPLSAHRNRGMPAAESAPADKTAAQQTARPCVLVAEDDPINFKLAEKFLNLLHMDCVRAKNGREAVDVFASGNFQAVLMDVQMPVMDGIQATREIRRIESNHRTPIIALTANVLPEDREKCQEAGMDGFVAKPFRKEDLRLALVAAGILIETGKETSA